MLGTENIPNRRPNKKKQRRRQVLSILLLFLLSVAVGLASFFFISGFNPIKDFTPASIAHSVTNRPINILLLGVDAGDGNTRTDTMIVASVDPKSKTVNMISIPRDTRIYLKANEAIKINAAHAIGGPDMALEQAEKLLGISIPYYVKVNFEGFQKVVDAVGGVEINVEKRLHYIDRAGKTYININSGWQKLNGEQALNFARFRHDPLGDLGRVKRQQAFLDSLSKKLFEPENIIKWPVLMKEMSDYVETNMNLAEMTSFSTLLRDKDGVVVSMSTVPGEAQYIDGLSYFLPDQYALADLVKTKVLREKNTDVAQAADSITFDPANLKVEVLNGTGMSGLANKLAEALRQKGFQVVNVGNADSFNYQETQILDRTEGKQQLVQQIARMVGTSRLQQASKETATTDLTIIIGKNFNQ